MGKRIGAGEVHKAGLVALLPTLDQRTKVSKSILASAKMFLAATLDEFDDFKDVAKFVENFPDAFEEDELEKIKEEFEHFSQEYSDVWDRDPNVLRGIAEEITDVGGKLGVDVSDWADPLLRKAEEIEQEYGDPETEEPDNKWLEESSALRDVDAMFEGLLREIRERTS